MLLWGDGYENFAGLFQQLGSTHSYQISPDFGKGFVERIILRNGVEVSICTMEKMQVIEFVYQMEEAKKIIIDNMQEPLSITELAREIDLNTYKLKVGFKEMWGNTIFGYLRDMRMEKARLLLVGGGNSSVIDVAQEVGYSNPSHFAGAFRKKFGINPSKYAGEYREISK
ncbi:MAG: AraC family transcriptional regulator [Bacillota bacterium]|nr:AraC family transcriptional regulator [Bacillota bacterium]